MKKLMLGLLIGILTCGGLVLLANPPAVSGDSLLPGFRDDRETIGYLNLTTEQTDAIRRFREKLNKESSPLRVQEMERNTELKLLWFQPKPDPDKLKAKMKQIHDIKQQNQEKKVDFWIAFRSVLTPEQDARFLALIGDQVFQPPQGPPEPRGGGGRPGSRRQDDRRPPPPDSPPEQ